MRTRAERNRGFESVKRNLFDAGVAVVNAAEAQEQLFDASVKALAEAVGIETEDSTKVLAGAIGVEAEDSREIESCTTSPSINSIVGKLMTQRQEAEAAGDFDSYIDAEQKLETLYELEVVRLEREARKLEAQIRIQNAQKQLTLLSQAPTPSSLKPEPEPAPASKTPEAWTESKLKEKFKTLEGVRKEFSVKAKSWKEAVDLANQRER
ncbi:MAG: hypothetical protein HC781_07475 [Leptolyngbyaceae cyanobacterium CSU_1_4]|nr:hypothetical protein [Leptolyngbyaceae cyanobacterium CSU_1_4]